MNKLYFIFAIILFATNLLVAQTDNQELYKNTQTLNKLPEFIGGEAKLMKFIASNIKYPKEALSNKISGTVLVDFVVLSTGEISQVKLAKKVSPLLDQEALRVIKIMPKWKPGIKGEKPVNVLMQIPVGFKF